jgi:hypothetical protein
VTSVSLDSTFDLLTLVFDDDTVAPEVVEDALFNAGYVIDRLPRFLPPPER